MLAALADGTVGVAQVRELARAHANPRAGGQLAAAEAVLLDHAQHLPFDAFKTVVRRWEQLADADGAHRNHDDAHTGRHAAMCELGDSFHLDARFGAAQGTAMRRILDQLHHAEFAAEWAELTARYGDAATPTMMERSATQRRADALAAIFDRAASADPAADGPDPIVNIVIDEATWLAHLARSLGDDDAELPDPATVTGRRCETVDGTLLDPADVIAAAVVGHLRRMVVNAAGVDHRPRTQLPLLHRQRPHRGAPPRGQLHLPRLPEPALPDRPHHPLGPRRQYQPGQRRAALSPPQPLEDTRLPHLARPPRPMAHLPTRRHRTPRRLTARRRTADRAGRAARQRAAWASAMTVASRSSLTGGRSVSPAAS